MPDYTIGVAERIASLPDSFATANSVNRNYFQETNQSVINKVTVALAPDTPSALDPNPDTTYATSTDENSVGTYGQQDGPLFITLLATIEEAGELSEYLLRADPAFWFSNLAISLNTLSEANKNIVANLEIGQQIAVTKTFPAGVVPQTVTEYLFVEGISHNVTVDNHIVTIYTGPASTFLQWVLGNYATTVTRTNLISNPNFELNSANWFPLGAASPTLARTTLQSYIGTASLMCTATASGGMRAFFNPTPVMPVTAGLSYTLSAYTKAATVARSVDYIIDWYNAGGGLISSSTSGTSTNSTLTWTRATPLTATAPVGAVNALAQIRFNSVAASEVHYLDAVLFEQATSGLPYFDGTYDDPYTGYTLTFQAWNGAADNASSTTVWGLNSSGTGSALGDSTYGLA